MPTVGVFAAIFDEQRRLLCVKQNYGACHWTNPGGAMEAGESPSVALEREVCEESGYLVQTGHLIGVYAKPVRDDIVLFFTAHILGREAWQPDNEITEVGFFAQDQLPVPMSEPSRIRIQDAFDGRTGVYRVFQDMNSTLNESA
ncbi:MAG: NUDIX domain-containing protein [Chloroflexota bacterium]